MREIFLLLLFAASMSHAQQSPWQKFVDNDTWRIFGKSESGASFLTKGAIKKGQIYDFWLKIESPPIVECQGNAFAKSPYDNVICEEKKKSTTQIQVAHMIIDCKMKKSKMQENIMYSYTGTPLHTDEGKKADWSIIFPDSMIEGMYKTFCS